MTQPMPALVDSHLPFVIKLAREYRHPGVPFEDLINEGNVGLVEAARRFEPDRGVHFTTYAAWWIRKYMLKALREQSRLVRIPDHQLRLVQAAREEAAEASQRLGGPAEIRDDAFTHVELSLSEHADDGRRTPLLESIPDPGSHSPEQHAVRRDLEQHLERALSCLSARAWRVLRDRFGLDGDRALTLKEVGEREGISRERVRQIELEALERLRRVLTRGGSVAPNHGGYSKSCVTLIAFE